VVRHLRIRFRRWRNDRVREPPVKPRGLGEKFVTRSPRVLAKSSLLVALELFTAKLNRWAELFTVGCGEPWVALLAAC